MARIIIARGLGEFDLIESEGGRETLFTHPRVVAKGLLQAVENKN